MAVQVDVDAAAEELWAVVADYGCDPRWRRGVATMDPAPPGPVHPGQTTDERMRFAGRGYRNGGEVLEVGPGRRFRWRTTSSVDAEGGRSVEDIGAGRSRVRFEVRIRPHGTDRLLAPVLRIVLRRALLADLVRLRDLVEAGSVHSPVDRSAPHRPDRGRLGGWTPAP